MITLPCPVVNMTQVTIDRTSPISHHVDLSQPYTINLSHIHHAAIYFNRGRHTGERGGVVVREEAIRMNQAICMCSAVVYDHINVNGRVLYKGEIKFIGIAWRNLVMKTNG